MSFTWKTKSADAVASSRIAFTALFDKIKTALQKKKIFITVK